MGIRRQSREWALQFLFQRDFQHDDLPSDLELFWQDKHPSPRALSFAEEIIYGVEANRAAYDRLIAQYADRWDVKRMGGVERNVMRMALYEMLHRSDIPPVVSIDEAVEIAKRYSSNESGRFVNGILDRLLRERPMPPAETSTHGLMD